MMAREDLPQYLSNSPLALSMLEVKDLQPAVRKLAKLFGWEYYHTHDSRKSEAGFPDLVLVRDGRLIFAELKREKKQPTDDQMKWLNKLSQCENAEVYVWKPSHYLSGEIQNILK